MINDEKMKICPANLTAENGMKYKLSGEFFERLECVDDDGTCGETKIPVSWSTIKEIYDKATSGCDIVEVMSVDQIMNFRMFKPSGEYRHENVIRAERNLLSELSENGFKFVKEVQNDCD